MAKQKAEWTNSLSIFWLKKHGYLDRNLSYRSGGIEWTSGFSDNKSSIGFSVIREHWGTPQETTYMKLQYTYTNSWTGEKESVRYTVPLTTSACNYGRVRYWFVCPLTKNGRYCGKRVGVLYGAGKYFGCRYCGDIAYAAQRKGGKLRGSSVNMPDIERLENEIQRHYYNGKPTRKHARLMKMKAELNRDFIMMAGYLDKRFGRLANLSK